MSHTPTPPDREAVRARGKEGQKATASTEDGGGPSPSTSAESCGIPAANVATT